MRKILLLAALGALLNLAATADAQAQGYGESVLADSPLFYWNFNEPGDLDPAIDQVGADAGDNLLPEGNATRVASGTTGGGASLGRAASFDGTQLTKFYSGALSPTVNPDAWAIEMWIRPQGPDPGTRSDYILEARGPGANNVPGILLDYAGGANDVVEVFRGARTGSAGPVLTNNTWHHLVIGYYGAANDQVDFYLNGAPAGSAVGYAGDIPFGTDQIAVGNSVPGHPDFDHFTGQIDELAVYDLTGLNTIALSARLADIAAHHAAVPEPTAGALLAIAIPALMARRRK
jgi:hypothetical protein